VNESGTIIWQELFNILVELFDILKGNPDLLKRHNALYAFLEYNAIEIPGDQERYKWLKLDKKCGSTHGKCKNYMNILKNSICCCCNEDWKPKYLTIYKDYLVYSPSPDDES
jgi:hypothetical protein